MTNGPTISRRRVLQLAATSAVGGIAGCAEQLEAAPETSPQPSTASASTPAATATSTPTATETQTESPDPTESPRENPKTIFVGPDGSDADEGTMNEPLASIQFAINRAQPGETIHVFDGEYGENLETVRSGKPDDPITITGSPEAVIRPPESVERVRDLFRIQHDHFHLVGLSFDGLHVSGDATSIGDYGANSIVFCQPPLESDAYLKDIKIKPARVGHAQRSMIGMKRSKYVEVGEFEVTGMAGAHYVLTGEENRHAGELVYIGTPPTDYGKPNYYEWTDIDQTSNIHVHHVDNSAGHPHSELVNTKLGTHDVLVEYCTDGGGSQNTEPYPPSSIHFQSYNATVRWCRILGGEGHGVHINSGAEGYLDKVNDPPISRETAGTGHSVYGNEFRGLGTSTMSFSHADPEKQEILCGNEIEGTDGRATQECPSSVPRGEGIGHLGGSSPWDG